MEQRNVLASCEPELDNSQSLKMATISLANHKSTKLARTAHQQTAKGQWYPIRI